MMKHSLNKYRSLLLATRANDWRFSFIPLIFGNLYLWIILFDIPFSTNSVLLLVLSLITSFGFAALGYFINEFFDKKDDAKAGKINKLKLISLKKQFWLLIFILFFTFIPWLILPFNTTTIVLVLIQIALYVLYCVPPMRLKKNVYLSLVTDALYAYSVPLLLSYYTYYLFAGSKAINFFLLLSYSLLLFLAGIRNIIIHYINDIFKDKLAGLMTLPRVIGLNYTNGLLKILLFSELLTCSFVITLVSMKHQMLWLLFVIVLFLIYKAINQSKTLHDNIIVNKPIRHLPDLYYQLYAPAIILLALIFYNINWIILVPIHIALFIPFFRFHPIISWFQRINFKLYYIWVRQLLSWIVNYTIFYLFLLIGVNLKRRNISALGYLKMKLQIK